MLVQDALIYLLTPIFVFALSGLFPQTPFGRLLSRLSSKYAQRIASHKRKSPQHVTFPKRYAMLHNMGAAGLLTSLVLIGILGGKYAFTPLATFVYPETIIIPNGGHYFVAGVTMALFVITLTLLGTLLCLLTKEGSYWHYQATRAAHDGQVLLKGAAHKTDVALHHNQIEIFAGSVDIKSLARQNFRRQLLDSAIVIVAAIPMGIFAIRSVIAVDDQGIRKTNIIGTAHAIGWAEINTLTLGIESSSGGNAHNIPSLQARTASGTTMELWGDVFIDITPALIATCTIARTHQVPIEISPSMRSNIQYFNPSAQQKIQSVVDSCATSVIDCNAKAFPALRQLLCP